MRGETRKGRHDRYVRSALLHLMEREIELTGAEIIYLWEKVYKDDYPEGLNLRKAAEAVLLEIGAHRIREELCQRSLT